MPVDKLWWKFALWYLINYPNFCHDIYLIQFYNFVWSEGDTYFALYVASICRLILSLNSSLNIQLSNCYRCIVQYFRVLAFNWAKSVEERLLLLAFFIVNYIMSKRSTRGINGFTYGSSYYTLFFITICNTCLSAFDCLQIYNHDKSAVSFNYYLSFFYCTQNLM